MSGWFLHPWFLLGLAGLAVPIALHLMHREVPRRIVFPSLRFVMKGHRDRAGRKSLRDLWTLLARLAVLTLLVLLFAGLRPPPAAPAAASAAGREQVLVFVDLSMSLQGGDFGAFAEAAAGRLAEAHPGADFALVASSNRVDKLLPFGVGDWRATLAELRPGQVPGRHGEALAAAARLFGPAPAAAPRHCYLLTDLQRSDWLGADLSAFPADVALHVERPAWAGTGNLAIANVQTELFGQDRGRGLRATVSLRNWGLSEGRGKLVLRAGGRSAGTPVNIGALAGAKYVLDLPDPEGNAATVLLESGEGYQLDNRWELYCGPRRPWRVALVGNETDAEARMGLFFLRHALGTSSPGVPAIEVRPVAPALAVLEDFRAFDAVFLLDGVAELPEPDLTRLREYLQQGGTLVYLPGAHAGESLALLNHQGFCRSRLLGLQGGALQGRATTIAEIAPNAALTDLFRREPTDLTQFPIYRFARYEAAPEARVLLAMTGKEPFLIQEQAGQGELYLFAVALGAPWSEFATSMSFVPLVRRLVESRQETGRGVLRLELGTDPGAALAAAGLAAETALPDQPGVCWRESLPLELNYSRAESDLRTLEGYEVLGRRGHAGGAPVLAGSAALPGQPVTWRPWLALALLAGFALELLLANVRRQ